MEKVQVEPVVACLAQLEAAGRSLPMMVLACLVGLVAHLLVELVLSRSACVWAATWSLPHDLCVPCVQPLVLYVCRWQYMISNSAEDCCHARSHGKEGSPTWEWESCVCVCKSGFGEVDCGRRWISTLTYLDGSWW